MPGSLAKELGERKVNKMRALSASQAVWPAMLRTYRLLFQPFDWRTFLKLAAVAVVTEGVLVNFKFYVPNAVPIDEDSIDFAALVHSPGFVLFAVWASAAAFVVGLLLYYAIARLRFAVFHCVAYETRSIRDGLALYRKQAERFCIANLVVWIALFALAVIVVLAFVVVIFVVFKVRTPEGKLDPGVFLILFFPAAGFGLIVFLTALASEIVIHDFILPHMALEDLSFREALKVVWTRIKANKETFFSYFILRLLIPILVGAALAFTCWIFLAIVFGVLGMSAAGFDALLDGSAGIRGYIRIALEVLFVGLGIGIGVSVAASFGGPMAVWVRCYALEFYSGHYKLLATVLHPAVEPSIVVEGSSKVG